MRVSISLTNYAWPDGIRGLDTVVRAADDAGLDTVWVQDHLIPAAPGADPDSPMYEAYTLLGYLAARTSTVRIGTMVTAVTYRPPALLIKAVSTLQALTGGRAWLGVGSGYLAAEATAMGLPLPPQAERFECLEDTLRLAAQMWDGDQKPFHGRHFGLAAPAVHPVPAVRPRVLVAGMGERKTLRFVAKYADACNLPGIPDGGATIRHKLAVLAEHCAAEGRDIGEIETTVSTRLEPGESAAEFAARCAQFQSWGIDHIGVITSEPFTVDAVHTVAAATGK